MQVTRLEHQEITKAHIRLDQKSGILTERDSTLVCTARDSIEHHSKFINFPQPFICPFLSFFEKMFPCTRRHWPQLVQSKPVCSPHNPMSKVLVFPLGATCSPQLLAGWCVQTHQLVANVGGESVCDGKYVIEKVHGVQGSSLCLDDMPYFPLWETIRRPL